MTELSRWPAVEKIINEYVETSNKIISNAEILYAKAKTVGGMEAMEVGCQATDLRILGQTRIQVATHLTDYWKSQLQGGEAPALPLWRPNTQAYREYVQLQSTIEEFLRESEPEPESETERKMERMAEKFMDKAIREDRRNK
jgi:hypothetical protein